MPSELKSKDPSQDLMVLSVSFLIRIIFAYSLKGPVEQCFKHFKSNFGSIINKKPREDLNN